VRPGEAQYQDAFYRACFILLGNVYLTSEWAGKSLGGEVDFQLKCKRWAIECVRDGKELEEHIAMFQPGGRYNKCIISGEIQEYVILDFRKSKPRKPRGTAMFCPLGLLNADHPGDVPLLFIVFTDDFDKYTIYDAKLDRVGETRALVK
jgi:hypothetical protein